MRFDVHAVRRHQRDQRLAQPRRRLGTEICIAHAGPSHPRMTAPNDRTIERAGYDVKLHDNRPQTPIDGTGGE